MAIQFKGGVGDVEGLLTRCGLTFDYQKIERNKYQFVTTGGIKVNCTPRRRVTTLSFPGAGRSNGLAVGALQAVLSVYDEVLSNVLIW